MAGIFEKVVDAFNSDNFNNWVSGKSTPKVGVDANVGFDVPSIQKVGLTAVSAIIFAFMFKYFLDRYPTITLVFGGLILMGTIVFLTQPEPVKKTTA